MAVKDPIRMCKGHKSPLLDCVGTVKQSDFFDSWSPFLDGKMSYCKNCVDKIFNYYYNATNDYRIAIWYSCQKLDLPFIEEVYEKIIEEKHTNFNMKLYINAILRNKTKREVWSDFSSSNAKILGMEEAKNIKQIQLDSVKKLETIWGKQDEVEDYDFLEKTFERYTIGIEFSNSQQEDLYRDLCRDRLILRKINDCRYGGEETIDKVQNRISKTMSILKVDQFESNKPKTASEQLIFSKIAQIEQTKPADLYKEPTKYKDFNKIKKYYKDLVLRPLGNTLAGNRDFNISIEDINEYNIEIEED